MGGKMLDEATTTPPHRRLKDIFGQMFPHMGAKVVKWSNMERDAVKLDLIDGKCIIFHYENDRKWRLETINSYLKSDWGK